MVPAVVRRQPEALAVQPKAGAANAIGVSSDERAKVAISLLVTIEGIISEYNVGEYAPAVRNQDLLNRASIIQHGHNHPVIIFQIITKYLISVSGRSK